MEQKKKERIALFRFGVISGLIGLRKSAKGHREAVLKQITDTAWDIPYSDRSYISRSTVLSWLKRYRQQGEDLSSLIPRGRSDKGNCKSIDPEIQKTLLNMREEFRGMSVPALLDMARSQQIIPVSFTGSTQSVYRLFKKHGLTETFETKPLKRFEAELPNDLWQSDCMHGPKIIDQEGKRRKTYLFAIIDDHSRLIPHAQFYLRENIDCYSDCLQKALSKRGLPRKLYLDNGPCFRSHQLKYACASLGIALIHATAYHPEGKGKIERWFRSVRDQLLPKCQKGFDLLKLNACLYEWVEHKYHTHKHGSTKEKPIDRFSKSIHLLREPPEKLNDYFRKRLTRLVLNDSSVSIDGRRYEVPMGLGGKKVDLLYHKNEMDRIEVFYNERSWGYLKQLDAHVNARVGKRRAKKNKDETQQGGPDNSAPESGQLF